MHVEKLELFNFRGFERAVVDLDPRLTVLVGENGAGKTSVLDALALTFDQYVARLIGSRSSARRLAWSDTREGSTETKVRVTVQREGQEFRWAVQKQGQRQRVLRPLASDFEGLNELVRQTALGSVDGPDYLRGELVPVYYDQRRALLDIPKRKRGAAKHEPKDVFLESRSPGGVDFRALTYWFQERETEELRRQKRERSYVDTQLDAVRRAIVTATGFSDPTYRIDPPRGLSVRKGDVELHIEQLSTGERAFLALAGDLARRLSMLVGVGADPLQARALVLIDEVELHLHPGWQRKILPWLMETFPNCQLVVSTHSPQVIGEVEACHIRVLTPGTHGCEVRHVEASYGRDSNYLLLSIFGAGERSDRVKTALRRMSTHIQRGELDKARRALERLRAAMEGSAPEISIAEAQIERRERLRA